MIKVGIYCPNWLLARHNTDHKVVKMFGRLNEFSDIQTEYVASDSYTLSFNFNKVLQRIFSSKQFLKHGLKKQQENLDLIYHYGQPLSPKPFFEAVNGSPVFLTSGFMTDRYVKDIFGKLIDRQKEADELAKTFVNADIVHFHTNGGRERFLKYRPDFKEKTAAIPFFLPNLTIAESDPFSMKESKPEINILFVGNEGIRKGLLKLVEALDLLGSSYLKSHNVTVTIVSKDKPKPKSNINLTWFTKLPHKEVIDLMQQASIFVLVPKNESYGLVLLEAMNSGCAIITDDDDTRKEIVGEAGLMLSSQTTTSIAKALKQLIENKDLRKDLGQNGIETVKKHFHPDVVANQYKNCFQTLLKEAI